MKKLIAMTGALLLSGTANAALMLSQDMEMTAGAKPVASNQASATAMWRECRPGPGDDRCIQAYEPGVKGAFEQWASRGSDTGMGGPELAMTDKTVTANMSGEPSMAMEKDPSLPMMDTSADMGGGGGAKPASSATGDMSGMDNVKGTDTAWSDKEEAASAVMKPDWQESAMAKAGMPLMTHPEMSKDMSDYTGVGGPTEEDAAALTSYPMCRSRSDDRCQQGS